MKNYYVLLLTFILSAYLIDNHGQTTPRQGEILISEIMVNPGSVSDANGEWFEIWNASNHDLLLNGLAIKDAGSNQHILASPGKLVLPFNTYWVLAKNGDILTNGGVVVNYTYQNFTLSNTSDQVIITTGDGFLIDQVSYTSGWPVVSGASMELHPDYQSFSENDAPEHWFPARVAFGNGDKGSPGKPNPVSSSLDEWEQGIRLDIFPNPSQGRFILEATFSKPQSGEIRLINILGQEFLFKKFNDREVLSEVIEPNYLSPGIWFIEIFAGGRVKANRIIVEQ